MEKQLLHITLRDKINNSIIRNKTNVKDILESIKRKGGQMEMGRTCVGRLKDNRWTRRLKNGAQGQEKKEEGRDEDGEMT